MHVTVEYMHIWGSWKRTVMVSKDFDQNLSPSFTRCRHGFTLWGWVAPAPWAERIEILFEMETLWHCYIGSPAAWGSTFDAAVARLLGHLLMLLLLKNSCLGRPVPKTSVMSALYDSEFVVSLDVDTNRTTCTTSDSAVKGKCQLVNGTLPAPAWVDGQCDNVVSKVCVSKVCVFVVVIMLSLRSVCL